MMKFMFVLLLILSTTCFAIFNDQGLEVIRRAAEPQTPGSKAEAVLKTRIIDADGNPITSLNPLPTTGGGGGGSSAKVAVALARNVYSTTNVTTGAYVELIPALPDAVTELFVFDSSGRTLVIAVGAAASEVDKAYIVPGGNGELHLTIASGARVSVKAIGANATKGELSVTFLK